MQYYYDTVLGIDLKKKKFKLQFTSRNILANSTKINTHTYATSSTQAHHNMIYINTLTHPKNCPEITAFNNPLTKFSCIL